MKILVLNQLSSRHMDQLLRVDPASEIVSSTLKEAEQHIADTDILVAWGSTHIENLFAKAKQLKWIHALSAGVENLNIAPLIDHNIILTNSKGIHGIPVSEHVFALLLSFTRGLHLCAKNQQAKVWKRVYTDELYEKTLAIIGLGSIGREVAKKAKAFGMNVVATKREVTTEIFIDRLYNPAELDDMLAISDVVVVALPLTPETHNYIQRHHFAAMKKSAYFINIARGDVVVEADLIAALQSEEIQGAGLDVFMNEPLPKTSPLWEMSNVIITPHSAAMSPYYMDRAMKLFADNLSRFIEKTDMHNVIDKYKGY